MIGAPEILAVVLVVAATAGWACAAFWLVRFARDAVDRVRLHRTERTRRIWRETDAVLEMAERRMKEAPDPPQVIEWRKEQGR